MYIMSFLHKVVSGRSSKWNAASFSKVVSFRRGLVVLLKAARISSAMRVKESLGPDMVMSEVEVEATGGRRDSKATVRSVFRSSWLGSSSDWQ